MSKSIGQVLRQEREKKGLSLEQVAAETNIRIHFLQAIEEDRMGAISSQTQLRGFTRLYASYLGCNPVDLLEPVTPKIEQEVPPSGPENPSEISDSSQKKEGLSGLLKRKEKPEIESGESKNAPEEEQPEKISDSIFIGIGADLQRQREALGLSRFDIERQIKIRELYIYALENGQIDDLPSTVQGRGMLNNYAAFMNLDPEPLQMRFAEGLQQRRVEKQAEEEALRKNPPVRKFSAPITGWRRYLTPDILIGSGVFVVLFVLVIWGALQVIDTAHLQSKPTAEVISSILLSTETQQAASEEPTVDVTPEVTETLLEEGELANTASVDLLATISAVGNKPIQIVVVAYQRAFLKVVVDGMEQFTGRVVPGQAYPFSGSSKITLTTGNAAAIQVYYNQQDLGILGGNGQVINMDFSKAGMATATPQFTAVPTATNMPTFTQQPTYTPTVTPTEIVPTVTPYRP